jgi:phosphate transport system permease protein
VAPDADNVAVGDTIVVTVLVNADTPLSSIVLDFQYDRTKAQVVSVATTSDWPGSTLTVRDQVVKTLIDRANSGVDVGGVLTGVVQNIGVNIPEADSDLSVSGTFLTFTLKPLKTGTLTVGVDNVQTVWTDGTQQDGVGSSVTITIGTPGGANGSGSGGLDVDWLLLITATVLAVELLGCILLFVLPPETIKAGLLRRLPPWPYMISLMLGLIPVVAFAGIVVVLAVNSLPAFSNPGIGPLLSTQFSGAYYGTGHGAWGLLPAIVGTVEIVLISLIVAFPVALALAIITTEFPMGPVGRIVRPLVGLMSGIPPIVYAVSMVIFVRVLMIPKFAGDQPGFSGFNPSLLGASSWPPSGVPWNPGSMPWDVLEANSSLLAGILVALLLIPFMTPMIADAIRDVPSSTREASLALGANRLYTLRKAVLPRAMPAIFTAVVLGALKAAGDVVIVTFAAGGEADNIPNPILDIFEHAPSLPVQGANMIIPFKLIGASTPYDPESAAIGYLCALVLLVLAAALVLEVNYLRARWRKRLAG